MVKQKEKLWMNRGESPHIPYLPPSLVIAIRFCQYANQIDIMLNWKEKLWMNRGESPHIASSPPFLVMAIKPVMTFPA